MDKIKYSDGYKYVLEEHFTCMTPVVGVAISDELFNLFHNGQLTIRKGFPWDGPSGPTWDTASAMTASLVHDVFCLVMRDGRLDYETWHHIVNDLFKQQCLERGMWKVRATLWHAGVEFANAGDPSQGPDRIIKEAP